MLQLAIHKYYIYNILKIFKVMLNQHNFKLGLTNTYRIECFISSAVDIYWLIIYFL